AGAASRPGFVDLGGRCRVGVNQIVKLTVRTGVEHGGFVDTGPVRRTDAVNAGSSGKRLIRLVVVDPARRSVSASVAPPPRVLAASTRRRDPAVSRLQRAVLGQI